MQLNCENTMQTCALVYRRIAQKRLDQIVEKVELHFINENILKIMQNLTIINANGCINNVIRKHEEVSLGTRIRVKIYHK